MSRTIKSFEEFHGLDEQIEFEDDQQLDEGIFGALADKLKNGLSRMLGGRIAKLDAIYGRLGSNGKMTGTPTGELGKLEYDFIVSNVELDEEILKKMSAGRQLSNSTTKVPPEALIANNEFVKRIDLLRQANKKRHDARKTAIMDKIERIIGDNQRAGTYSEAMAAQLTAAIAETEYNLRKKFASDEELEKLEDKLVIARKDAKDRAERLNAMLNQMGLANSQATPQAPPAPVASANGRQAAPAAAGSAPPPVAPHAYRP